MQQKLSIYYLVEGLRLIHFTTVNYMLIIYHWNAKHMSKSSVYTQTNI